VEAGGTIEIRTEILKDKIGVSIRNTGNVFQPEALKEIWQRFSKLDRARSMHRGSSGLGLAIVQEIMKAHEESIDVISNEEIGVLFRLTLPSESIHKI
jgi:signal transduction histidine kinase